MGRRHASPERRVGTRTGWLGLLVSGVCFITPAMLLVLALAWAYVRFGSVPQTGWILYGVEPVIVAIVVSVLVMTPIVLGSVIPHFPLRWLPELAWPWYVPLGTSVTVVVGWGSSLVREAS